MKELIDNIDKLHTTKLGIERIKRNLEIDSDAVMFSKKVILNSKTMITRKGKNYYCRYNDILITVNANSYTIITAHLIKDGDCDGIKS